MMQQYGTSAENSKIEDPIFLCLCGNLFGISLLCISLFLYLAVPTGIAPTKCPACHGEGSLACLHPPRQSQGVHYGHAGKTGERVGCSNGTRVHIVVALRLIPIPPTCMLILPTNMLHTV